MPFPTGRLWKLDLRTKGLLLGNPGLPLYPQQPYRLGRHGDCEIVVSSYFYRTVSRHHAVLEAIEGGSHPGWQIRDLGSANGTFVNDRLLEEPHRLQSGDRIQLGKTGPLFRFETLETAVSPAIPLAVPHLVASPVSAEVAEVTLSQLFPLLSTGSELLRSASYGLGILTVAIGVSLFVGFGNPLVFNALLALYLAFGLYYLFIYQLCGKPKPWFLLLGMAGITAFMLNSPVMRIFLWFFRELLPGTTIAPPPSLPGTQLAQLFSQTLLGTGLMEELLKALPVLALVAFGLTQSPQWRQRWGIVDPLDGILLCTASAVGFTLVETLGQYVPQVTQQSGQLAGLQLLIPRLLGSIAGHLAYSGYFGYFIGLSCWLSRRPMPQTIALILIGYGSAALLHTLWNVAGALSPILLGISGFLSYSLLMAAILKARSLSRTNL